jgi:hypothetical protein
VFEKTLRLFIAALCAYLTSGHVLGQAVDNIAVERRGDATTINIRFITHVQYLRHTPLDFGNTVQIFVQFTGGGLQPSDLIPQTKRILRTGDTPEIAVSFPEAGNSLRVTFDKPQKFTVSSSPDGSSIVISLPSPAGK